MSDTNQSSLDKEAALAMTSEIVSAFVANNSLPASELQSLLTDTFATVNALGGVEQKTEQKPAVPVKKSVTDDYLICLEDGKKLKMLKRYLRTQYDMSPEDYRRKWGLPADYPMVAPSYAKRRSEFAKQIGLGSQGGRKPAGKRAAKKKAA